MQTEFILYFIGLGLTGKMIRLDYIYKYKT